MRFKFPEMKTLQPHQGGKQNTGRSFQHVQQPGAQQMGSVLNPTPPTGAGPAYVAESTGPALPLPRATEAGQPGKGGCRICLWKGEEMNSDGRGQELPQEADSIKETTTRNWGQELWLVVTTGTKKLRAEGGRGRPWSGTTRRHRRVARREHRRQEPGSGGEATQVACWEWREQGAAVPGVQGTLGLDVCMVGKGSCAQERMAQGKPRHDRDSCASQQPAPKLFSSYCTEAFGEGSQESM